MSKKELSIPISDWADFRQEFGQLLGKVDSIEEQTKKTNGTVQRHNAEIDELKTKVEVNKTKLAVIVGGSVMVIQLLLSVLKDNLIK